MDDSSHCRLREQNLAFFSKIGADVSHEMRNVLSIIGEYAGLLDDLLAAADRGRPLDNEKLRKLAASMTRQVKKGTEAMDRFSRFAHAADEPTATVDLTALLRSVIELARRHGSVPGCSIEAELAEASITINSNPFSLQHALYASLQLMLPPADDVRPVKVGLAKQDGAAVISLSRDVADEGEMPGDLSPLAALVAELGGRVEVSAANGSRLLTVTLPIE